jgi:DNA-binding PadR family transcriptional regulator
MPPNEHWLFGGRRFKPWFSRRWGPPAAFNPFVAELLSKGGGLLPLYVLHLLAQRPRYGNDIMRAIEERTEGRWASNPGAVYPLLNALEDGGFVVGDWEEEARRTRRNYRLTPEGQTEYERLKQVMRPMLEEAISVLRKLYNDLEMNDHQD